MEDKTTTIYLVRHGAIDLKDGEAIEENPPLNKKGIEQAKKLGKQFKEVDPELNKVVTSTMKRSVQTAEIICDYLGLKYSSFPEFNEFSRKVFKKKILTNKFWVSYSKLKKHVKNSRKF